MISQLYPKICEYNLALSLLDSLPLLITSIVVDSNIAKGVDLKRGRATKSKVGNLQLNMYVPCNINDSAFKKGIREIAKKEQFNVDWDDFSRISYINTPTGISKKEYTPYIIGLLMGAGIIVDTQEGTKYKPVTDDIRSLIFYNTDVKEAVSSDIIEGASDYSSTTKKGKNKKKPSKSPGGQSSITTEASVSTSFTKGPKLAHKEGL